MKGKSQVHLLASAQLSIMLMEMMQQIRSLLPVMVPWSQLAVRSSQIELQLYTLKWESHL